MVTFLSEWGHFILLVIICLELTNIRNQSKDNLKEMRKQIERLETYLGNCNNSTELAVVELRTIKELLGFIQNNTDKSK